MDSVRLAEALAKAAHAKGKKLDVLLQVSIDGDTSRGGVLFRRSRNWLA